MSGQAPWSKGCLEAVCERLERGPCLRPVDAKDVSAGPDDYSSAWLFAPSFARARIGAGHYSGFQAFSVSSHRFVSALDVDHTSAAKDRIASFVQAATGRSSYMTPLVIFENDARDLVVVRHRSQVELVFDRLALEHRTRP